MPDRNRSKQNAQYQRVVIDGNVYQQLKDYCDLNHLTITSMATKYIREGLMTEKYGDAPFMKMGVKNETIDIYPAAPIKEHKDELMDSMDRIDVIKVAISKPISAITQNIIIEKGGTTTPMEGNVVTLEENEKLNNKITKKRRLN